MGPAAAAVRPLDRVNAAAETRASWVYENPYEAQTPFIRIRARNRLAAYGDPGNIVLVDPAQGNPFVAEGTAAPDLTQDILPADETTPDGGAAWRYRASNRQRPAFRLDQDRGQAARGRGYLRGIGAWDCG